MRASAVAGLVFANTNDNLLKKLTAKRSMASVPYGARYRLIDFSLSNLVNAGVTTVGIVTKENYRSLMDHVGNGIYWDLDRKNGGLYLLPPYVSSGLKRYRGTVDALNGANDYISRCTADYIVLCNSDTVANVDINEALKSHIDNNADVTLIYHNGKLPENNSDIMIPEFNKQGRVKSIEFGREDDTADFHIGITIINRDLLIRLVDEAYADGAEDFAKDVLAKKVEKIRIYGFCHKEFVALMDGTKGYYDSSMKLLDEEARHQLFNRERPIFTKTRDDMPTRYGTKSSVSNCIIADGCVINGTVKNSILFRGVTIQKDAVVENCILMQETSVGTGTQLDNVISDKNAVIGEDMVLKGTKKECFFIKKNQNI